MTGGRRPAKPKNARRPAAKRRPTSKTTRRPRKKKMTLRQRAGIAALSGLVLMLVWSLLSPTPGAFVLRQALNSDNTGAHDSLLEHAPDDAAASLLNQRYYTESPDANLDVYYPNTATPAEKFPVVIWTHGGAFISGDKGDAAGYYQLLASRGYTVVVPNYSLAPGEHYPAQVRELNEAHRYVLDHADLLHADTNAIVLAGDSAGATLAAQLAAAITNPDHARTIPLTPVIKRDQLRGVVLACGLFDLKKLGEPGGQLPLPKVFSWGDTTVLWSYSGTRNADQGIVEQLSPQFHVTGFFPPTFITGGNGDRLTAAQSVPFADKLQALGVPVTRLFPPADRTPALGHEYQFNLDDTAGTEAFTAIVGFLDSVS